MPRPNRRNAQRTKLLELLADGSRDGDALASLLGMNPRTFCRLVADLRASGIRILSVREGRTCSYQLATPPEARP